MTVGAGQYLTLRWFDLNDGAGSHGLGVDNMAVRFTPVPEPAGVLLVAAVGLGAVRRRLARAG